MKGKTKIWELRDISGTVCGPNAVLAFLMGALCVAILVRSWPLFIVHANSVVIAKIMKKNRKTHRDSFFIIKKFLNLQENNLLFLCVIKLSKANNKIE